MASGLADAVCLCAGVCVCVRRRKRYEKAEDEYVAAKLELHRKTELKEQLTEHLCAIIQQNEQRKALKLEELMQQLQLQEEEQQQEKEQRQEEPPTAAAAAEVAASGGGTEAVVSGGETQENGVGTEQEVDH